MSINIKRLKHLHENFLIVTNNSEVKELMSIFLVAMLLSVAHVANGQNQCEVLLDRISGEYVGDCKKGLAHGVGKALGSDTYEGEFKRGYPHGNGKYESSNEVYDGSWSKGMKDGAGTLVIHLAKKDSVVKGYWRDNRYLGETNLPAYNVNQKLNLARYSVKSTKFAGPDRVTIFITEYDGTRSNISELLVSSSSGNQQEFGNRIIINNVDYPLSTKVTYTAYHKFTGTPVTVVFDITINEPGSWNLKLTNS